MGEGRFWGGKVNGCDGGAVLLVVFQGIPPGRGAVHAFSEPGELVSGYLLGDSLGRQPLIVELVDSSDFVCIFMHCHVSRFATVGWYF